MVNKKKQLAFEKKVTMVLCLSFIFILSGAFLISQSYNQKTSFIQPEPNYKFLVLSRMVPIGYGTPTEDDIDTQLNLRGTDGDTYRLFAGGKFPNNGLLFVSKIE